MSEGMDPKQQSVHVFRDEESSSGILNDLLGSTLGNHKRSLSDLEWRKLQEVAASCRASGVDFEQFAVALVSAFLSSRFPSTAAPPEALARMSQRIGRTLCSDPVSRGRLEKLLGHLAEVDCDR